MPSVEIKAAAGLKNLGGASDAAQETYDFSTLVFGNPGPPVLLSSDVRDYDNFNEAWSGGDEIVLTFDRATDQGRLRANGDRAYVDSLLGFSHRLGEGYSGAWGSSSSSSSVDRPHVRGLRSSSTRPSLIGLRS